MGGVSYGQNPTVKIDLSQPTRDISSYVIGACRNHVNDETTNGLITNFGDKMEEYGLIKPRFGKERKLYRLGGTVIDGGSGLYPGFFASQSYGTGPYPYDDLEYFTDEANTLNADMIVGINVGTGTLDDAYKTIDYINDHQLWKNVAYFELGNELYGFWQYGHNEYACSVENYLARAEYFITNMENHAGRDLKFAVMGAYNSGWGTYPTTARIVRSGNTYRAETNPNMDWIFPNGKSYEWRYFDGSGNAVVVGPNQSNQITLNNATDVRVFIHSGTQYNMPYIAATASADANCGNSNWDTNTSDCLPILQKYFSPNSPLMNNGIPIFDYVAFHLYPQPNPFPQPEDAYMEAGPFPDKGQCLGTNLPDDDIFGWVMALNKWTIDILEEKSPNGVSPDSILRKNGVKLVNTEFGSIGITGNPSKLTHSISEGLFAADNILTAINYDMPGAIAFSLFHTNKSWETEHSDNLFFPLDQGDPYPVFYVQKLIAENLGEKLILKSTIDNPQTLTTVSCDNNSLEYEKYGAAPTIDNDGTIRVLLLNRDTEGGTININIDGFIPSNYMAEIITYHATSVLGKPTSFTTSPISLTLDANGSFPVNIDKFSVNILKLTPIITPICHDYTITTSTTWPDAANYPGPYGKVEVTSGATLIISGEARFCTDGELIISDGGKVDLNGTLTADDVYWKGVRMTGNNASTSFTSSSSATIEKATTAIYCTIGSIDCQGTTFQNNRGGVDLWGTQTETKFTNCTFQNTDQFSYPNDVFAGFVRLSFLAKTAEFSSCSFIEKRLSPKDNDDVGIITFNSNFTVDGGEFRKLIYGVDVTNFGIPSGNYKVKNAKFYNCRIGVEAYFATGVDVRDNEFNLDDPYRKGNSWQQKRQYGVHFSGTATNFVLEHNTFNRVCDDYNDCNKVGTQVDNLGVTDNVIRRNIFNNVTYANFALSSNGDVHSGTGLLYECNKMNDSDIDFYVTNNSVIKLNQGSFVDNNFQPADNIFHPNPWNKDFIHDGGIQSDINYYWNCSDCEPEQVTSNVHVISTINANNGCNTSSPRVERKLTDAEKKELFDLYKELALNSDEAKLAFESAKLGDDKALLEQKRRELAYALHLKWEAVKKGMQSARIEGNRNEARVWLRRFGTYGADILLAQDFAVTQEWVSAQRVLDMLPQKYELTNTEYDEIRTIQRIFELLETDGLVRLSDPSKSELDEIARDGTGIPRAMAQSILAYHGQHYPPVYVEVPAQTTEENSEEGSEGPKMTVSPNPADYNVNFDWSNFLVMEDQDVTIEISNKIGGLITILHPSKGVQTMEWTTESVSSGILYYRLLIGGVEKDSGQLFINK